MSSEKSSVGAMEALAVLVAMADEDELCALDSTLAEEGRDAAREALAAARQRVARDIDVYMGDSLK